MVSRVEVQVCCLFAYWNLPVFVQKWSKLCDIWPKMTQNQRLSDFFILCPNFVYHLIFAIPLSWKSERLTSVNSLLPFYGSQVRLFRNQTSYFVQFCSTKIRTNSFLPQIRNKIYIGQTLVCFNYFTSIFCGKVAIWFAYDRFQATSVHIVHKI